MSKIALLVFAAFAFHVMNRNERLRLLRPAVVLLRLTKRSVTGMLDGTRWLIIGLFSGNPWAVAGVVTAAALVLNAHTRTVDWQALTDVRPEIEKLIAVEEHTSHLYDAAVAQFKVGTLSAERLARLIETTLIPELQETTLRIESLSQIPTEQRPLLVQAKQYLQLRSESWRLRAEALEKRSLDALKSAERIERVSLEALERVRHGW
jgi:hypothetical protein